MQQPLSKAPQSFWRPGTAQFCTACYDRYIKLPDDFELPSTCNVGIQCDLLPPTADVLTDTEIVETSPVFISLSPKRRRNETSYDASQPSRFSDAVRILAKMLYDRETLRLTTENDAPELSLFFLMTYYER
jgi:hypothetical protein